MSNLVAVYGSLLATLQNHRILRDSRLVDGDDIMGFDMFDLGTFPAIRPGVGRIYVEVYEVTDEVLADLDHLEGHPRFYVRTPVRTGAGREVSVYVLARDPSPSCPRVLNAHGDGDWLTHFRAKQARQEKEASRT